MHSDRPPGKNLSLVSQSVYQGPPIFVRNRRKSAPQPTDGSRGTVALAAGQLTLMSFPFSFRLRQQ